MGTGTSSKGGGGSWGLLRGLAPVVGSHGMAGEGARITHTQLTLTQLEVNGYHDEALAWGLVGGSGADLHGLQAAAAAVCLCLGVCVFV